MCPCNGRLLYLALFLLGWLFAGCSGKDAPGATIPPDACLLSSSATFVRSLPRFNADVKEPLTADFLLYNDLSEPVTFEQVSKSCACSNVEVDSMSLRPGEATKVRIVTNPRDKSGLQRFSASLWTGKTQRWTCVAEAFIYHTVSLTRNPIHLGAVPVNGSQNCTVDITVFPEPRATPRVDRVRADIGDVVVFVGEMAEKDDRLGGRCFTLPVSMKLSPQSAAGDKSSRVCIDIEVGGRTIQQEIVLCWRVLSKYSLAPARVVFSSHEQAISIEPQSVQLVSESCAPVQILQAEAADDRIAIELIDRNKLVVKLRDPKIAQSFFAEVRIKTTDSQEPAVTLPVSVIHR
jgi:hypothetical protein